MENFKRIEQKPTAKISLPQAEAVISLYKEKFEDNPERIEKLKEIFDVFLEQSLTNSDVYSSKELKASFPWTVVRLQDIAKKLFKKNYKGDQVFNIENTDEEITKNKKLEFIFGSAFAYSHGDAFAFTEEAMHQIIKRLPSAIKALQQGLEPEDFEVFTLGMPTNTFGEISTDFSDNLKKDSYEYMGRLYSEFVTEKTASEKDVKQNIKFYGISMGGGFAAKTGEKLLENKVVTQESENVDGVSVENKPYLQIQSMVPVSMGL
ncbi:MAG: hypothetical protein WCJ74_01875, partial [bacterium]